MNPRTRFPKLILGAILVAGGAVHPACVLAADYRATIGLQRLRNGGYLVANGRGIEVAQVESGLGGYVPNWNDYEFKGKDFEFEGTGLAISSHATVVGKLIYGRGNGIAPKVDDVYLFSDASFVGTRSVQGLLNPWRGRKPGKLRADVINSSWAGTFADPTLDAGALRRMDYAIWRDDAVAVNSTYNESWRPTLPPLMASSYNGITVGRTAGSRGGPATVDGGATRAKPDLVAPMGTTSEATAVVSGAAALLLSEAEARRMKPGALAIKSMLMAGAGRPSDWQRGDGAEGSEAPLSYQYGAGELRIDRSFHIMAAGQQKEHRSAARRGWASDKLSGKGKDDYYELSYASVTPEFTAVLTWHRRFSKRGSSYDNLTPILADLELELLRKKGKKWSLFARSDSAVDNVEMIVVEGLPAGQYRLAVGGGKNEPYGLAWDAESSRRHMAPGGVSIEREAGDTILPMPALEASAGALLAVSVPEPTGALLWSLPALGLAARRRRRCC